MDTEPQDTEKREKGFTYMMVLSHNAQKGFFVPCMKKDRQKNTKTSMSKHERKENNIFF